MPDDGNDDYLHQAKEARRDRNFRCTFCGWTTAAGLTDYKAWTALDKHDRTEHPGRSWADWTDDGMNRYLASRTWK